MRYGRLHELIDVLSYVGAGLLGSGIGISISAGFNIWLLVSSVVGASLLALKYIVEFRERRLRNQLSKELEAEPWFNEWSQSLEKDFLVGDEELSRLE